MTLLQTKDILYVWLKSRAWELQNWPCLLKKQFLEENPTLEKGQNFSQNWEKKQKNPLVLYFCFLPHSVYVSVFHCMRKWLHSCLEISVQGPSASAQFSLANLSKVSPFHCLLPFLLLGHCCLLFSLPRWLLLTSVLVPFFLPPPPFLLPSFMQMLPTSPLLLANSSTLYPFPEQLKGRKLVEIGETTAFKPGYRSNVSAVPHKWKSLQRDFVFLLWVKTLCSHIVSQFVTGRFLHADCKSRGETEQEGLGGCVQFELQHIVLPTGNKDSPWCQLLYFWCTGQEASIFHSPMFSR